MGLRCEGRDADGGDEHQREAESDDTGDRHGVPPSVEWPQLFAATADQ